MKNQYQPLTNKRIGVFGKGGAGKSTVTIFLARTLRQRGYEVCVLDADSTNIGLSQALGVAPSPDTLLNYFGGMVFSGGLVTCPVDDPTPLENAEIYLDELSPQYYARSDDGITILIAGKIGAGGPGAGCDGPIAKIARDVIIHGRNEDPITLIDFKAGFEDSARGVLTSLDWAIVVIDPTIASLEMAVNMRSMVDQIKDDILPATAHLENPALVAVANKIFTNSKIEHVFFVLNRIPDVEIENALQEKLDQRDIKPIGVIPEIPSISFAWLNDAPVHAEEILVQVCAIVDKFEQFAADNS